MSNLKNYYHEEISNRDGEAYEPYECANCNGMTLHGTLCDECLAELKEIANQDKTQARKEERLTTIERLPNMLEEQRKFHQTKAPWEKRK